MLIMKCSQCEKYISSPLLAEISTIACEHCGTTVPVANVLVSSNGFTFDRNDLLKRFFRYRKLLDEVIDERNAMASNPQVSEASKRSIDQFMRILQGMMTGARGHFRCSVETGLETRVTYPSGQGLGKFVNLSMEGACVEMSSSASLPRVGGMIALEFALPDQDKKINLPGVVCWTQKGKGAGFNHNIGVKFGGYDEKIKQLLWDYLSRHSEIVTE